MTNVLSEIRKLDLASWGDRYKLEGILAPYNDGESRMPDYLGNPFFPQNREIPAEYNLLRFSWSSCEFNRQNQDVKKPLPKKWEDLFGHLFITSAIEFQKYCEKIGEDQTQENIGIKLFANLGRDMADLANSMSHEGIHGNRVSFWKSQTKQEEIDDKEYSESLRMLELMKKGTEVYYDLSFKFIEKIFSNILYRPRILLQNPAANRIHDIRTKADKANQMVRMQKNTDRPSNEFFQETCRVSSMYIDLQNLLELYEKAV